MSQRPVDNIFPDMYKLKEAGKCPTCGTIIDQKAFRDRLSVKEYGISGMCQKCQDKVFGKV
jgi:hypothetical protein